VTDLERALLELNVEWPETPDIAAAVRPRLAARRRWRVRLAALAAAILVAAGGTLAVSPAARSTVERWLGLKSVEIKRGPVPTPRPGASLPLGRPVSLATARRSANLPVRAVDRPDAIYLGRLPGGQPVVSFVYTPRRGLPRSNVTGVAMLVQVFHARFGAFIQKTLAGAARATRVKDGYWLQGAHGFGYEAGGVFQYETQRVADTTLLIERDGVLIRVEGTMSKAQALDIAAHVR
jgi:hypothetical protein